MDECNSYGVLVRGANRDGSQRGLVTIIHLIDPRPYTFQPAVYGRLIYTVIDMSDHLLTQENPNPHLTPPPDLRSPWYEEVFSDLEGECSKCGQAGR